MSPAWSNPEEQMSVRVSEQHANLCHLSSAREPLEIKAHMVRAPRPRLKYFAFLWFRIRPRSPVNHPGFRPLPKCRRQVEQKICTKCFKIGRSKMLYYKKKKKCLKGDGGVAGKKGGNDKMECCCWFIFVNSSSPMTTPRSGRR